MPVHPCAVSGRANDSPCAVTRGHDRTQPPRTASDSARVRGKAITGSTDPGTTGAGHVRPSAYGGVDFGGPLGDTPMSMEGTVIGQYRVLRKLGEGGMGAV